MGIFPGAQEEEEAQDQHVRYGVGVGGMGSVYYLQCRMSN